MWKGLPQSAVLSPVLYSIYTREVIKEIEKDVQVRQFADDITVYTRVDYMESVIGRLSKSVETVMVNLRKLGLDLQPDKTAILEFGKTEGRRRRVQIRVQNTSIISQREVTFLGILFDEECNMEKQVNRIKKRVLIAKIAQNVQ